MRRILWNLRCDAVMIGYHIRPFDMLADRRRWFWQSRTPCNRSRVDAHLDACERMASRWSEADEPTRSALWRDVHTTAEILRSNLGR